MAHTARSPNRGKYRHDVAEGTQKAAKGFTLPKEYKDQHAKNKAAAKAASKKSSK